STNLNFEWLRTDLKPQDTSGQKSETDNYLRTEHTATPFENVLDCSPTELFVIRPRTGQLDCESSTSFELICAPDKVGEFSGTYRLILKEAPVSIPNSTDRTKADLVPLELELRATVVTLPITLEPSVLNIPGKQPLGVPIHRFIKLINNSLDCPITFCWQPNIFTRRSPSQDSTCQPDEAAISTDHSSKGSSQLSANLSRSINERNDSDDSDGQFDTLIVFEPNMGVVAPGRTVSIDVNVCSSQTGLCHHIIPCHIDSLPGSPLWLRVEVDFRAHNELTIQPATGVIEPFNSITLSLTLKPRSIGSYRGRLQLESEQCPEILNIKTLAEVQTPLMDISPPHAHLKSIFRGVKTCTNVELVNLTLLKADFEWLPVSMFLN
ncbi:hypothetical protein PHET_02874, partial [Paragonimus heterotremus]